MCRGSCLHPRPLAGRRGLRVDCARDMKPKRSAEGVAALRFAASFEEDPAVRGPDRIAGSLLSRHLEMIGRVGVLRYPVLRRYRRVLPGIYEYHIIRTAYIDQIVTREVAAGSEQVVILGAGFDTRAIRMRDALTHTHVFEVDHPTTCRRKKSCLAHLGRLPSNLTFVAVDFETADLRRALRDAVPEPTRVHYSSGKACQCS